MVDMLLPSLVIMTFTDTDLSKTVGGTKWEKKDGLKFHMMNINLCVRFSVRSMAGQEYSMLLECMETSCRTYQKFKLKVKTVSYLLLGV